MKHNSSLYVLKVHYLHDYINSFQDLFSLVAYYLLCISLFSFASPWSSSCSSSGWCPGRNLKVGWSWTRMVVTVHSHLHPLNEAKDQKIEITFCLDTLSAFDMDIALSWSWSLDSTLESMILGILIRLPLPLILFRISSLDSLWRKLWIIYIRYVYSHLARDRKIEITFCLDTLAALDFVFALSWSWSLDSTLESMILGILIRLPLPLILFRISSLDSLWRKLWIIYIRYVYSHLARDRKIEITFCLDTSAAFDFVFALSWLSWSLDSTLES